ncbi:MAG: methionine adenosyltransferase [Treponema sp.]|nr:methionine adenosyltransferase [Treponema sp.]
MSSFDNKINKNHYLFTSESVGEGHPDKLCDQVSDAVLDYCLSLDKDVHVACETFSTTDFLLVGGEIGFQNYKVENPKEFNANIERIARKVAVDIGYTSKDVGLDGNNCLFMNRLHAQSADINQGVVGKGLDEYEGQQGAGDQGMMFGFACNDTPVLMPAPIYYSHQILLKAHELRHSGKIGWLRPDAKSQVTVEYDENHKPLRIDTVVVSHQHNPEVEYSTIKDTIINQIIKPVLEPTGLLDENTKFFINPTGKFVIGGPDGDSGLTGRKIIVDTYGGMGRHGGGCFSGKDPSKVDRSAAYMARYIAKNIVAAGLADRAEIELAYAIGVPFPVSILVETFGTEKVERGKIEAAVERIFDCTPAGIIKTLNLKQPIYQKTASYGHFGREGFPWEKTDKVEELKKEVLR